MSAVKGTSDHTWHRGPRTAPHAECLCCPEIWLHDHDEPQTLCTHSECVS